MPVSPWPALPPCAGVALTTLDAGVTLATLNTRVALATLDAGVTMAALRARVALAALDAGVALAALVPVSP